MTIKDVIYLLRPKTLLIGIAPIVWGTAFASEVYPINWLGAWACLGVVICLQMATNVFNDVKDFQSGTDQSEGRIGQIRMTASGRLTPDQVLLIGRLCLSLGLIFGIYLVMLTGIIGLVILLFSAWAAWAYTGGPVPLSHWMLGEILAIIFFGPVALGGAYYLQTHSINGAVLESSLALGLLAGTVMLINNYRDRQTDQQANKYTLAIALPAIGVKVLFLVMHWLALGLSAHVWIVRAQFPAPFYAIAWVLSVLLIVRFWVSDGVAFNKLLGLNAAYLFLFALGNSMLLMN